MYSVHILLETGRGHTAITNQVEQTILKLSGKIQTHISITYISDRQRGDGFSNKMLTSYSIFAGIRGVPNF